MTYREPARGYGTVWLFSALFVAGFVLDAFLGGAVTHLPGWLAAYALVIGVDLLVIHAARSTHSLTLTDDELRVGDEAIGRDEIVGVTRDVDRSLPALGWPVGLPRGVRGLGVRLADDRDVVVPTRYPDRLVAALGVAEPDPVAAQPVRTASKDDLASLPEIDERAETVFRVAGYALPRIPFDVAGLADAIAIFVVGTPPVAYLVLDDVDETAHVAELAVLPGSMRRGIGSRLLTHAAEWARAQGYRAITLITYADVPWNGPFYAKHGFVEVPPSTPELARRRARQTELGLDAVGRRIVMRREL